MDPQETVMDIHNSTPLPSLLYGWRDIDGDGVVEILDPHPYGITTDQASKTP